jgi:hypothetical protein
MGMSFFTSCPLTWGLSVPLQTMCTSNSSLSLRDFVRVHLFEAAYQLVFVRARVKKDIPMLTISFLLYITLERSVGVIC